jgi:hypothetical protein
MSPAKALQAQLQAQQHCWAQQQHHDGLVL